MGQYFCYFAKSCDVECYLCSNIGIQCRCLTGDNGNKFCRMCGVTLPGVGTEKKNHVRSVAHLP